MRQIVSGSFQRELIGIGKNSLEPSMNLVALALKTFRD